MGSLNKATLCGNIGTDIKVTQMQTGNKCAQFSLATSDPAYTLQNGTQVPERTEWHNIVCWGGTASIAERMLSKGMQVLIEGKIRTRKYTSNKDNMEHYMTEIVAENLVLLRGNFNQVQQQNGAPVQQAPQQQLQQPKDPNADLPF